MCSLKRVCGSAKRHQNDLRLFRVLAAPTFAARFTKWWVDGIQLSGDQTSESVIIIIIEQHVCTRDMYVSMGKSTTSEAWTVKGFCSSGYFSELKLGHGPGVAQTAAHQAQLDHPPPPGLLLIPIADTKALLPLESLVLGTEVC